MTLSIQSGSSAPGATVNLNIPITTTGTLAASVQWTMSYSVADVSAVNVTAGAAATAAGKSVACSPTGAGVLNCIAFGVNTTGISNGVLAVAAVTISASTTSTLTNISLTGAIAASGDNPPVALVASPASPNVVNGVISISQPSLSAVTITTSPSGLQVLVDGSSYTAPQMFQWTPGSTHTIGIASPQGTGSTRYVYASWSDGGAQSHSITTPGSAVTYTASFTTQYQLTTSANPSSAGTVSPASGNFYNAGATVQVTATPNSGQQFTGWSGDASGTTNPTTVSMTAPRSVVANFTSASQNITVTTNPSGLQITVDGTTYTAPQTFQWAPGSSHTIATTSPQGSGSTRYVYASWSDGGAQSHSVTAPSSAATYTANFTTQYQLTTSANPSNAGTVTPASGSFYNAGTSVQVTATPNSGQQFTGWSGDATGTTNPVMVSMTAPRNVVASFTAASQGITITTNPSGLQITVDGTTYTAPQTFQWTPGSSHTIATTSPQGSGSTRYVYASWSDGGAQSHTVTAPSSAATYTANFTTQYQLTTSANPSNAGTVTPASGSFYNAGTSVQVTATPNSGQQFTGWSGDATGTTNPVTVSMTAPRNVVASFTAASQGITVTTNPSGLQITVDGTIYTAPQTFQWTPGSSHTIATTSPQGSGSTRYVYASWSDGGAQSHTVTAPSSAATYTANFTTQYQLTTSANPSNAGTVTPAAGSFYNAGTSVQVTATPNSGQQFTGWSGDATGTTNPVTITMSAPRNVVASFTGASQGVTITTNPSGLQITVDGTTYTAPQTFQWTPGSSHTIATTSPQGSGSTRYVFANWNNNGGQSQTITTPAIATTYTASFTTQYQLTTSANPSNAGTVSPGSGSFLNAGTAVQVTATPNSGRQFTGWSGDAAGDANPLILTMSAPRNVVANFGTSAPGTIITTIPSGLQIIVDGGVYTSPQTFSWAEGSTHTIGVASPQGGGGTRYAFQSWSDGGAPSHTVTVSASSTYTAFFKTQHKVTVSTSPAAGGTVELSPVSPDGFYDSGAIVQANATPGPGFQFQSWSGAVSQSSRLISFTVSSPLAVTANFGGLQDECGVSLSRNSFAAASEGDFNRVMVETGPGCAWNASSNSSWIVLNSGVSGVGRGTVGFLVLGNFSPSFRSGVIMVNGQSFTITQASANCGSNVLITNAVQPALPTGESTITLNVSAPVGCQWSASAPSGWLTILNGALGSGPGTVQVGVAANSSTLPRVGSVQIGGSAALLLQLGTSTPQFYRDVSPDNIFLPNISLLVLNNILSGCTDTEFCPELNATRSDIAPMLIRALFGDNFTYSQSPYFTDVPPTHPNFRFIQKMRELNITVGCTPSQFCPGDSVTRGQMAAFLIRAKLGGSGIPTQGTGIPTVYPTSPMFVDVPVTHPFFPFVQKIKQLGITFGCSVASYCPDGLTRRGEASAFITRSFLAQ